MAERLCCDRRLFLSIVANPPHPVPYLYLHTIIHNTSLNIHIASPGIGIDPKNYNAARNGTIRKMALSLFWPLAFRWLG